MMATSHIPILVLGSPQTAVARFVERIGIGTVAAYEKVSFAEAVRYIMQPDVNLAMRRRALAGAARFTDVGAAEWIWQSLALNRPIDTRFEDIISTAPNENSGNCRLPAEPREGSIMSPPSDSNRGSADVGEFLGTPERVAANGMFSHERDFLRKLLRAGYRPDVVFDIGASNGKWSEAIATVLPDATFELFEPLAGYSTNSEGLTDRLRCLKRARIHRIALGEANGEQAMCVGDDLDGSSLRDRGDIPEIRERIPVKVFRLDDFVTENRLPQPDIVKIDCQGAEDSIIRGGMETVSDADVLLLETWLVRGYGPKTPLLTELIEMLRPLSFVVVEIGERFYDERHRLYSVDAFFCSERLITKFQLPA
jgi:FkbM family methyltransferase